MTAGRVLCWVASLQPPEHTSIGSDPPAPSPGAPADPSFLPWGPQHPGFSYEATPAFPCLGELPETLSARQFEATFPDCLHHPDIRPHSFRRWWPPLAWGGHRARPAAPPHPARGLWLCPLAALLDGLADLVLSPLRGLPARPHLYPHPLVSRGLGAFGLCPTWSVSPRRVPWAPCPVSVTSETSNVPQEWTLSNRLWVIWAEGGARGGSEPPLPPGPEAWGAAAPWSAAAPAVPGGLGQLSPEATRLSLQCARSRGLHVGAPPRPACPTPAPRMSWASGVCPEPLEGARGCALQLMLCSWSISCAACPVPCRHPQICICTG